jgi:hypothetical protein
MSDSLAFALTFMDRTIVGRGRNRMSEPEEEILD